MKVYNVNIKNGDFGNDIVVSCETIGKGKAQILKGLHSAGYDLYRFTDINLTRCHSLDKYADIITKPMDRLDVETLAITNRC